MSGEQKPQNVRRFAVDVRHDANDLLGSVEVISTCSHAAREMALRVFFREGGWRVTRVTDIEADYQWFVGAA